MKYLVIEEKSMNPNVALQIVRKYYPRTRQPKRRRGRIEFSFLASQLTKEKACEIAHNLKMRVIYLSEAKAVIGY